MKTYQKKTSTKSKFTADEIVASVNELLTLVEPKPVVDVVPKGFYTSRFLAEKAGVSWVTMRKRLLKKVRTGEVEIRRFKIDGKPLKIPHYAVKRP